MACGIQSEQRIEEPGGHDGRHDDAREWRHRLGQANSGGKQHHGQAGRSAHRGVHADQHGTALSDLREVERGMNDDADDGGRDERKDTDRERDGKIVDRHAGRHHRRHRPQQPGGDGQPRAWGPQLPASHVDRSSSR